MEKPFGLWSSPIQPGMISRRTRLDEVQWAADGETLLWVEGRAGRGVLMLRRLGDAPRELTGDEAVRGGIGYGGGEFAAGDDQVIFAERSGRLFQRSLGFGLARPITPEFGTAAAPALSPDGRRVAYIFSDGHNDCLALVDSEGRGWPLKLAQGADFYMQPSWHPDGLRLAWVEWDHPHMPWEETRLMLGRVRPDGAALEGVTVLGGEENEIFLQPLFSPDGRWLSYIRSKGEWQSLMVLDLSSGERREVLSGEFDLMPPVWVQGVRTTGWSPDSASLYSIRNFAGRASLWQVPLDGSTARPLDTGPYTWLSQLSVSSKGRLAFLASAPQVPDRVVSLDEHGLHVEARSEGELIDPAYYPEPQAITWQATDGELVHGLYYPPANPRFESRGLPPAFVYIHGGPTSQTSTSFNAQAAYYTSRGYGWLAVNYRGSSGYGRSYLRALNGRWGEADVADVVGAARALGEQGLADPKRLVIRGGSAGGYTVLNVLAHYPGLFKAGIALYPVGNLFTIAMETHKFEERYQDSLVGPLPEAAQQYRDWSPYFHLGKLRDPLALFHGSADKVVAVSQSERIAEALRANGVPHIFQVYEGEGHGFRKSENLLDFYQRVDRFMLENVIFSA